ncbi:MAG: glutamate synthase large subunit [Deltaproteobacteria bacterium]|nr:glutamate synthase large subunit [Deltaproteobacteria bacterium]
MTLQNQRQGLYDPRFERDGCGIGAIVNMRGERTHTVVRQALMILQNLRHRGATGYDAETGDGAGIILQKPHDFLLEIAEGSGISLPAASDYAVGMVFLPTEESQQQTIWDTFQSQTERVGLEWLGTRVVPVDPSVLGEAASAVQPAVFQIFIGRGSARDELAFNRSLYLARRLSEKIIGAQIGGANESFHVASLSVSTIVYKGMLLPEQVSSYYVDLTDPRLTSALAAVHSRFSTNTFPAWRLAHPFRWLCHNGEINTIRGNVNWFRAREVSLANELFGEFAEELRPLIRADQSDSACLDDAVELLVLTGRSVDEALRLLVPEAWQKNSFLDQARRAHCEYNATLMEPWDGPAALCFTDGVKLGVALDRSGLRPCRYTVTTDDTVILASEAGVLQVPADRVKVWGKLRPGEMMLIDTKQHRIISDFDLKSEAAAKFDYVGWAERHITQLEPRDPQISAENILELSRQQAAFAYTREELSMVLASIAQSGDELVTSMGDDTPLAILSQRSRLLFDYLKQQFAQVTNPPIDPLREDMVMSLTMYLGTKGNLAAPPSSSALLVKIESPILTPGELDSLERIPALKTCKLSTLFSPATGVAGMRMALCELVDDAVKQVRCGAALVVLSDRGVDAAHAAIPSVLAVSAVHHELVKLGLRTRADIIIETGEARSPHHFACLIGYGAAAVVPYLALASIQGLFANGDLAATLTYDSAVKSFLKGSQKGLLKIMSKMGITTLQSYCGAQIFEALGLSPQLVDDFFPGTSSRLAGLTFDDLARETIGRHRQSFDRSRPSEELPLPGGFIHYRFGGEQHAWSPEAIAKLQQATATGSFAAYADFSKLANAEMAAPTALRHLLTPLKQRTKVDLAAVEPAAEIVKRFTTGAMSLGAISQESHEALAIAMNRIGGKSNTGEGGEDPARFQPESPTLSRNSAIKQVASGRFGVTVHYLTNADEIQIKIAQGAKPGEGGQLPGHKVDQQIAKLRHSTPGVQLISPPPHHDIYSIEDLAQLIFDLKSANPRARVSVKLVSEAGIGAVAVGVAKAGADKILVAGDNGGTGASPLSSIKHAGAPWEVGLAEVHQTLLVNRLRDRVVIETDGQLRTGRDVVIAAALGADEFGFSTAPLIVQGCIMMRKCHLNTCPVGIATQDPVLRKRFSGKPEHVINYFFFVAEEVRTWMADLGITSFADLVGRTDLIGQRRVEGPGKARHLDLSPLLHKPQLTPKFTKRSGGYAPDTYDDSLVQQCRPALDDRTPVVLSRRINNARRATGTLLSGEVARRYGADGLPDNSITLRFEGIAGQSFGAFLAPGITANLIGAANDYVGKGLSGGRIVIIPPKQAQFIDDVPVVIGNTTLYGATSGSIYAAGAAGERFAVRNSGAFAVVEGVGDHGCEYMTGGVVVVLGAVGRNFAAGMSGGVAYVLDTDGLFHLRLNPGLVETSRLSVAGDEADVALLRQMIHRHISHTQSARAQAIMTNWEWHVAKFVKISPKSDGASASKKSVRVKSTKRSVGHEVQSHV